MAVVFPQLLFFSRAASLYKSDFFGGVDPIIHRSFPFVNIRRAGLMRTSFERNLLAVNSEDFILKMAVGRR